MSEHLILFDHECPLCQKAVRKIIALDTEKRFLFSPFQGKTADLVLCGPNAHYSNQNSLVLIERYQSTDRTFFSRAKATLRIYWLLGRKWSLFGALSYLPGWTGDLFLARIAQHRHQYKLPPTQAVGPPDRFLP